MGGWTVIYRRDELDGNAGVKTGFTAGESMPGEGDSSIEVVNHDGERVGVSVEYQHEDAEVSVMAELTPAEAEELAKRLLEERSQNMEA